MTSRCLIYGRPQVCDSKYHTPESQPYNVQVQEQCNERGSFRTWKEITRRMSTSQVNSAAQSTCRAVTSDILHGLLNLVPLSNPGTPLRACQVSLCADVGCSGNTREIAASLEGHSPEGVDEPSPCESICYASVNV